MHTTPSHGASRGAAADRSSRPGGAVLRQLWRLPRWALGLGLLVLLSGADPTPALRDAVTLEAVTDVRLERSAAYALLAPATGVYDALTLLTATQHYWLLGSLMVLYALWRLVGVPRRRSAFAWRALREAGLAAGAFAALLAVYAVGALAPRPMARLVADDPDAVVVDFHTHTRVSHDTWKRFTIARRSAWHGAAGFEATFVTDHATFGGSVTDDGTRPAPGGPMLLPAAEVRHHHQHVVLLGDLATHEALIVHGQVDSAQVEALRARGEPEPLVLLTLPARLAQLPAGGPGTLRIGGVEISDASPKGLEFGHRHRAALIALADSLDVPLFAGTNHHGWGSTVAAWNLVRVPGWRDMSPDTLAARIAGVMRAEGRAAVRVIERNPPRPTTRAAAAATMPSTAWRLFATMSWGERLGWLGWIAAAAAFAAWRSRRRAPAVARPAAG